MTRCLNLSRAGEYAIAALSRLAMEGGDAERPDLVSVESLARSQRIPRSFLSKILSQCARAGIVTAKKGPAGGVALARPAADIPLLEIIEACEGRYSRADCVFYPERHCDGPACEVYCPLRQDEDAVRDRLGKTTLADMARSLSVHPNYLKDEVLREDQNGSGH